MRDDGLNAGMGLKLLIIYDDDAFRGQLAERMRMEKYVVSEASPDAEAGDLLQRSNFDVVLLGACGSRNTCLSLLRMIKDKRPHTEVILLTSLEDHSLYGSMQAMQLGAFDDLLVPLDVSTLHHRIREAYQRKKERVKAVRSTVKESRKNRIGKPGDG